MPWLQKDKVLMIHIPRCGGTSLTKHHKVGIKAQEGHNLWNRFGIKYFNYRYRILEKANFPLLTYENAIALFQFSLATFLFFLLPPGIPVPFVMWTMSLSMFTMSTFIWTAPVLMRINALRYFFMGVQYYVLCKLNEDIVYLTGTNMNGYLLHLTAERCIRYGYVSERDMKSKSFSIVRNPYSRAVSVFMYNKRGCETFDHFIREFHGKCMKSFHKEGKTDSKDVYCHVLPMYAYTHIEGRQVINTIIKQEQLKRLVATEWKDSGVPKVIQEALTGIPHANSRKKRIPWQDYYTQETMDLVLEMYEKDFDTFGYDKCIPGRSDITPKVRTNVSNQNTETTEVREAGTLIRKSIGRDLEAQVTNLETNEETKYEESNTPTNRESSRKPERRVSISTKIQTNVYEQDQNIKSKVDEVSELRKLASLGQDTGESSGVGPKLLRRVSTYDASSSDIVSKKRAASAFVLQQVNVS